MYSLVLATMLTVGGEAPNHHWHHGGCHGCYGCWGSCYGCCGGWYGGCCGGCYGGYYGCYGCCGGYYGCCGGYYGCCGGCCGGYYAYPTYTYYYSVPLPAAPYTAPAPTPKGSEASGSQATVKILLPEDAKLYVDGQLASLTSSPRTFVTPRLQTGRQYYYTIKAEWTRDGKTLSDSQRVIVEAGKVAQVQFKEGTAVTKNTPTTESAPAHVTVRLPADAKLFVDGQVCSLKSNVRSFNTPALQAGKKFYYVLKTELVRDGKTETDSRKVVLEAGKKIEVDFNKAAVVRADD